MEQLERAPNLFKKTPRNLGGESVVEIKDPLMDISAQASRPNSGWAAPNQASDTLTLSTSTSARQALAKAVSDPMSLSTADLGQPRTIYVARDFFATMDSQLSVFVDDRLELLKDSDKHWWLVREPISSATGYIPSDIVETAAEREAKVNRTRNAQLTMHRESDAGNVLMQASDFPESKRGHRKSVSFSNAQPIEHVIESIEEVAAIAEELPPSELEAEQNDPTIDTFIRSISGAAAMRKPRSAPLPLAMLEDAHVTRAADAEVDDMHLIKNFARMALVEPPKKRSQKKPSFLKKLKGSPKKNASTIRIHSPATLALGQQMLKIYAGNFTAECGYKTLLIDEDVTLAELLILARDRFLVEDDGHEYDLSISHYLTNESLVVGPHFTLAVMIELAKRASLEDGEYLLKERRPKKISPGKLVKRQQLHHLERLQKILAEIKRDPTTDFVTQYRFVLNRHVNLSQQPPTPVYVRVVLTWPGNLHLDADRVVDLSGGSEEERTTAQEDGADDHKPRRCPSIVVISRRKGKAVIKALAHSAMKIEELLEKSLRALDVSKMSSGSSYEVYVQSSPHHERVPLEGDERLVDVLKRLTSDPSETIFLVKPVVS